MRHLLKEQCLSPLGKEKVDELTFSADADEVNEWLEQVREFRRLQAETDGLPLNYFFDVREAINRIRLENTHLEEDELFDLRRSLETIGNIVTFLNKGDRSQDEEDEAQAMAVMGNLAKVGLGLLLPESTALKVLPGTGLDSMALPAA